MIKSLLLKDFNQFRMIHIFKKWLHRNYAVLKEKMISVYGQNGF